MGLNLLRPGFAPMYLYDLMYMFLFSLYEGLRRSEGGERSYRLLYI